jgi:hypothetical protein
MATIVDGIVIGSAGGAIAGLTVWLVKYIHSKATKRLNVIAFINGSERIQLIIQVMNLGLLML